jgi:excisionase family DNA binding protein
MPLVGGDRIRGETSATGREPTAPSGWVTTQQAAKALGISPRTVRRHIDQGNLEAKPEGEGVKRTWLVSIDSLQAFRDARQVAGHSPGDYRAPAEDVDIAADSPGGAIRVLVDRLAEEAARASEYRVRLEISEKAQSTLEEELAEERRRREEAERERDELRHRLQTAAEPTGAPQSVWESLGEPERSAAQEPAERPQERPRGLWQRLFGG